MQGDAKLMWRGQPIDPVAIVPVRPTPAAPKEEEPEKPLIEQMHDEFLKLLDSDSEIPRYRERVRRHQYEIERIRRDITFRETYLKRRAAQIIRERHGIRIIPGWNDIGTAVAREVGRMPKRMKELFAKAGIALPPEFQDPIQKP